MSLNDAHTNEYIASTYIKVTNGRNYERVSKYSSSVWGLDYAEMINNLNYKETTTCPTG